MTKKCLFDKIGETSNGISIVAGVFSFYETNGVPLEDFLFLLKEKGLMPCWKSFCNDAHKNGKGMQHKRIISKLDTCIADSYGNDFKNIVISKLEKLNDLGELYK